MKKIQCPACGDVFAVEQQFCPICGKPSPEPFEPPTINQKEFGGECAACGARIAMERPLCPICGGKNKNAEVPVKSIR